MAAVHIRDVPDEVLSALKRRAARNDRSLQRELKQLLTAAAQQEPKESLPPLVLHLSPAQGASPETTWRREEIYGDDGR